MKSLPVSRRDAWPRGMFLLFVSLGLLGGCRAMPEGVRRARLTMAQEIPAEPAGDYFIGRRYYKPDYRFWGYVRRPGAPWRSAVLVMLNENRKLAPDREQLRFGFDNNYEYKLRGYFSGEKIYELVSNAIYPEFVVTDFELRSTSPAPILPTQIYGHAPVPGQIEKPE